MAAKKSNAKYYAIGLILIAVLGFGYYTDWTFKLEEAPTPGPGPEVGEVWQGGTFSLTVAGRDTLDSSASLTVGTDFTGDWYAFRNGGWVFLGAGSASGTDIESIPEDNGYIWLMVEEKSSKYYYADVSTTIARNTYILSEYKWTLVDSDQDKEFAYKVSLWNIPEPASGYPARTFYPYFLAESGQGTAANALQWQTQPSDISSIGTSTVTKYISWETKLTAEKRAVGIHKIVIEVNSTTTTKWEIDKVNIPGVGYIDGSLFEETVLTSKTQYKYVVGTDFDNIVYWKVPAGTNNKFDNTVAVKFTLASGDVLEFKLYVYQWLYDRTSTSDSDAVNCSA